MERAIFLVWLDELQKRISVLEKADVQGHIDAVDRETNGNGKELMRQRKKLERMTAAMNEIQGKLEQRCFNLETRHHQVINATEKIKEIQEKLETRLFNLEIRLNQVVKRLERLGS